jgi:hypothetical protein
MRYGLQHAFEVAEACGVLHNLAVRWGDIMPRDMFEDGENGNGPDEDDDDVIDYNLLPRYHL